MMKQLRNRITAILQNGSLKDCKEKGKLEFLLQTKRWNPYCIRHSAITYDSDYLPEYAVKKKARWSMNSRQGTHYVKSRMGADLRRTILMQNGITVEDDEALKPKPAVRDCPRCKHFRKQILLQMQLSSGPRCVRRNKRSGEFKIVFIGR